MPYLYQTCTGNYFIEDRELDEDQICEACGDTEIRLEFEFDDKEDFIKTYCEWNFNYADSKHFQPTEEQRQNAEKIYKQALS